MWLLAWMRGGLPRPLFSAQAPGTAVPECSLTQLSALPGNPLITILFQRHDTNLAKPCVASGVCWTFVVRAGLEIVTFACHVDADDPIGSRFVPVCQQTLGTIETCPGVRRSGLPGYLRQCRHLFAYVFFMCVPAPRPRLLAVWARIASHICRIRHHCLIV